MLLSLLSVVMIALLLMKPYLAISDDCEALREAMANTQLDAAMALAALSTAESVLAVALWSVNPWAILAASAGVAIAAAALTIIGSRAQAAARKYYDCISQYSQPKAGTNFSITTSI
jgi:hypothetical protein